MKYLSSALLICSVFFQSCAIGQTSPNQMSGAAIAQALLMSLTNPRGTEFRVGVTNTAAEFGVLLSPKGAEPAVEFLRGYSTERDSGWNLSWTARELLDGAARNLTLEVIRTKIISHGCVGLGLAMDRFYSELDAALQSTISLSEVPQRPASDGIIPVTVDGTSYLIQIWTGERTVIIHPDRDIDEELDNASGALLSLISGCSNTAPGKVEVHRRW